MSGKEGKFSRSTVANLNWEWVQGIVTGKLDNDPNFKITWICDVRLES